MKKNPLIILSLAALLSSCSIVWSLSSSESGASHTPSSSGQGTSSHTSSSESKGSSPVASVSINGKASFALGETFPFSASCLPADSTPTGYTWSSSNPSVLSLDAKTGSSVNVTALSLGSATITVNESSSAKMASIDVEVVENPGYRKFDGSEMNIILTDLDSTYTQSSGKVKTLFLPVSLICPEDKVGGVWNEETLAKAESFYLSEENPHSFVNYYKAVSNGHITPEGYIAPVLEYTAKTAEQLQSGSENAMAKTIDSWVQTTVENHPEIDWTEFDQNEDGFFDSIHIIHNYYVDTWDTNLWPHMSQIYSRTGTPEAPAVRTYSLACLDFYNGPFEDAIATIHEQGHFFGLMDYYSYSNRTTYPVDYVGLADMQDNNIFDWNSYSKLSVGWANPTVIDGSKDSVTVSIQPSAVNGDCILIPADYSTWNGSAFDEYFLIELFTPVGINEDDFASRNATAVPLGEGGCRVYHVDSHFIQRAWDEDEGCNVSTHFEGTSIDPEAYYWMACTNSYRSEDYATQSCEDCNDHPLLAVISATRENGFGDITKPIGNHAHWLKEEDLFHTGQTLDFDLAAPFMTKTGQPISAMNDGEIFPYTIHFDSVSKDLATITISK